MAVKQLDRSDQALLRRCLEFILTTDQLSGAFATRLGVEPEEVGAILERWPDAGDDTEDSTGTIAINNTLNEIVNGLAISRDDERAIGSSRGGVQALYWRWAQSCGRSASDLR